MWVDVLNADWHHLHLYNPQITSKRSNMPPFAFLYEVQAIEQSPSADALQFPPGSPYAPARVMKWCQPIKRGIGCLLAEFKT